MNRVFCPVVFCFFVSASLCQMSDVAFANEVDVRVDTGGCEGLDGGEIGDIVDVEISSRGYRGTEVMLSVDLSCGEDGSIHIEAFDPVSDKMLKRSISLVEGEMSNRVVAIAVSQLYMVSWWGPREEEKAPKSDAPEKEELSNDKTELSLGGGVRAASLGDVLWLVHTQLGLGRLFENKMGLSAYTAFDFGRSERDLGEVRAYGFSLGAALMRRFVLSRLFSLDLGGGLGAKYALIRGISKYEGIDDGRVGGFTGEAFVFVGPGLTFSRLLVALEFQGGYCITNPIAGVDGGDEVSVGGFMTGAALVLRYSI